MSNGKGSKPRPYNISYTQYCENWNNIFKKKKQTKTTPADCHKAECDLFVRDQNKKLKNEKTND